MKKCRKCLLPFSFAAVPDQPFLLIATVLLLLVGLAFFHEPMDLAYAGYMILLGAAIEYSGGWSRQWHYPGDPAGGVPLWFVSRWGGVDLFLLALPILARYEKRPSYATGH